MTEKKMFLSILTLLILITILWGRYHIMIPILQMEKLIHRVTCPRKQIAEMGWNPGNRLQGLYTQLPCYTVSVILALFSRHLLCARPQAQFIPHILTTELHFADEKAQNQRGTRSFCGWRIYLLSTCEDGFTSIHKCQNSSYCSLCSLVNVSFISIKLFSFMYF